MTAVPSGACDCHVHVFDPRFPFAGDRAYTPGEASGEQLDELHWRLGVSRAVLVQPSPYGTDNSCLLAQLRLRGERARGVVVVDPASEPPLREWHAAGVRGARVNLATFAVQDPEAALVPLRAAAAAIADFGWHLQVFTDLAVVAALADELARLPVPVVFDHFALARAAAGLGQPGFPELTDLLRSGAAYVKLSAPHRISTASEHADVAPVVRALVEAAPDRALWGTDWPHTGGRPRTAANRLTVEPFAKIDDASALDRLVEWAGPVASRRILVDNPVALYDF
ncbi:amidohydrolase family protein [Amycolatopsis acidiphila]|uniref:Amidohydrolase family protein n=1 Tax=Amycolatopsis acidiphila TaxID=715473 RepID=A0A558AE55_9PSEU|nr:amidohydrolase family protein [Amycolatopsis acidiphila]TVT22541.1 amidohydrolase family protein [Amycolatopsis acidiphila]GHG72197.1 hydrolase [Amycolatopsis acidiphila]